MVRSSLVLSCRRPICKNCDFRFYFAVDPRQTFLGLVEPEDLAPTFLDRASHYRARGVTAKLNLALSAPPDFVALRGDPVALRGRLLIAMRPVCTVL